MRFSVSLMMAFLFLVPACKKSKPKSTTFQDGFYLNPGVGCLEGPFVDALLILKGKASVARLFVVSDVCASSPLRLSEPDVKAFGLMSMGTTDEYFSFLESTGVKVQVQVQGNSILFDAGGAKSRSALALGPMSRDKEIGVLRGGYTNKANGDMRTYESIIKFAGPVLPEPYKPSMWCDSSTRKGFQSRIKNIELKPLDYGTDVFATVNGPDDPNRFSFPAKCRFSLGVVNSAGDLVDLAFSDPFTVE